MTLIALCHPAYLMLMIDVYVQLGTDCRLEMSIDGETSDCCNAVWHSSDHTDNGILWVSFTDHFH